MPIPIAPPLRGATQSSLPDYVYGKYADTGEASGGSVEVFEVSAPEGYEYLNYVYGGRVQDTGEATGNTVTMTGGEVGGVVYGSFVHGTGDATGNTVTITGGEVDDDVYGGYTYSGNATENAVTINDGYVGRDVYGGYVGESGDASGNTVTMSGGEVATDVYGGYTASGDATNNTVHLVGEGASYTVGETTYHGSAIAIQGSVHAGAAGGGGVSSNNSVHVYGTGINIGGTIDSSQRLNFHIVQGQAVPKVRPWSRLVETMATAWTWMAWSSASTAMP